MSTIEHREHRGAVISRLTSIVERTGLLWFFVLLVAIAPLTAAGAPRWRLARLPSVLPLGARLRIRHTEPDCGAGFRLARNLLPPAF